MAVTTVENGETITDVAVRVYGHATGALWLLEDNVLLGITSALTDGQTLSIRPDTVIMPVQVEAAFRQAKLADYELQPRQSFFDVLIENQADMQAVFALMENNQMDGVTEHLFVGDRLGILNEAMQPRMMETNRPFMPIATIEEADKSDGIGFMRVEKNFIVR